MLQKSEKIRLVSLVVVLAVGVAIGYRINTSRETKQLPILSPADINPELVDTSMQKVTHDHTIQDFTLVNQDGKQVHLESLENKVYVSDFFFTTCQGICLKMAVQMQRVYKAFENDDRVMFVSHTVMPEQDSVEALKAYADKYHAHTDKWMFLTGDKKQIYDLARKSYFAVTTKGDGGKSDFIHTENFILIDSHHRIRGFYDGTDPKQIDQLIDDIHLLLEEEGKQRRS
ncbi:MAG: SCO family protein [Flavobacteriales bacterium]|nr:SCO family protein [Flavobacteriales bacterium]MCB9448083.1 SCO family protein [Flavobacteriales bacterium]